MATIIVTGATGFIGGWLCPLLTRQGHEVHALLRRPEQLAALQAQCAARGGDPARLHALAGDLSQPGLGLASEGGSAPQADLIYHLGARFAWGLSRDEARAVNVEGGLEVVRLAAQAGARLVLMGGFMLENRVHQREIGIDPDNPLASPWPAIYRRVGAYEASKLEAHYRAVALAQELGVVWAAVHPATLCGHSESGELAAGQPMHELISNLAAGRLQAVPGSREHWLPLVSVDFLTALLAALAARPFASGTTLLALDEQTPGLDTLVADLASGLDCPAPTRHLPLPLLHLLLALPGAERFLRTRRESLAFIRRERYDTAVTRDFAATAGLVWPDIRQAIVRSGQWYGRQAAAL